MLSSDSSSGSRQIFHVREASQDEFSEAEALLAENFADNPATLLIFGKSPAVERLKRLFRDMTREPSIETWVATSEDRIVGVMKEVEWPRCNPNLAQKLFSTWDSLVALRWRALFTLTLYSGRKNHPNWAHRHLMILGVREDMRRKGVATDLLTHFCKRADKSNASAFLETDTIAARDLYGRFGFRTIATDNYDNVKFWYMWRNAAGEDNSSEDDTRMLEKPI